MVIYNDIIVFLLTSLFGRYYGITIFPFIFLKRDQRGNERSLTHERIHLRQQIECLIIFYPVFYFADYLYNRISLKHDAAYRAICFEREAYCNDHSENYLKCRALYSWVNYL
jgi:hypothetical protein